MTLEQAIELLREAREVNNFRREPAYDLWIGRDDDDTFVFVILKKGDKFVLHFDGDALGEHDTLELAQAAAVTAFVGFTR